MRVPSHLTGEAAKYFRKHAKRLVEAGIIDEADDDTLALCADIWGQLRRIDPDTDSKAAMRYNSLLKSWISLAKQLGLLPRDRKKSGIEPEQDLTDILAAKLERR